MWNEGSILYKSSLQLATVIRLVLNMEASVKVEPMKFTNWSLDVVYVNDSLKDVDVILVLMVTGT